MIQIPELLNQESTAPIIQQLYTIRSYVLSKLTVVFLLYLLSFVVFAIIRVITGVSIKRLGFMSLRHISFSPLSDTTVFIRSIKLSPHRPTFSRPGWFTLIINELDVTIDLSKAHKKKRRARFGKRTSNLQEHKRRNSHFNLETSDDNEDPVWSFAPPESMLYRVVRFILAHAKFFELTMTNTTFTVKEVASVNVGSVSLKIDLRKTTPSESKLQGTLDHYKFKPGEAPVMFGVMIQDIVITPLNLPSRITQEEFFLQTELLDYGYIETSGVIDLSNLALKDLSLTLKMGNLNVNIARLRKAMDQIKKAQLARKTQGEPSTSKETTTETDKNDTKEHSDQEGYDSFSESSFSEPESENDSNLEDDDPFGDQKSSSSSIGLENVSALATFGTILVRIVKEVDIKMEYINIHHLSLSNDNKSDSSVELACSVKHTALNIRRLNPRSSSFRLFFSEKDSAHQAIFSCNSVSVAFYKDNTQEEILYIPMITSLTKTNIFSTTLRLVKSSITDSNNGLLRTGISISSPSVNIDSRNIPYFLKAFSKDHKSQSSSSKSKSSRKFDFTSSAFQKLWPRAVIKFTIDEPAARITVNPSPKGQLPADPNATSPTEFNGIVVVSCSKIYSDFSSSHINDNGKQNYCLKSALHTSALEAFYQSKSGSRFNLLTTESLMVKVAALLIPTPSVICTANLGSIKVSALHDEVLEGLKEVTHHFMKPKTMEPKKKKKKKYFLRQFPAWLTHFYMNISNIHFAVASAKTFDPNIMFGTVLGIEIGVSNFIVDYRSRIEQQRDLAVLHKRTETMIFIDSETDATMNNSGIFHTHSTHKFPYSRGSDDRNLAITLEGIRCFKIKDNVSDMDNPFLSIPRLSVSFFVSSDDHGPFVRSSAILRSATICWDVNLQYLIMLSVHVIKSILPPKSPSMEEAQSTAVIHASERPPSIHINSGGTHSKTAVSSHTETHIINVQTGVIRLKANLPNDVRAMFETNSLIFSKKRDELDKLSATVIRVYTDHPTVPKGWTRLLVVQGLIATFKEPISNLSKPSKADENEQILLEMRSLRIHIASHLLVYRVLDNIVSSFKAVLLLADTVKTGQLSPGIVKLKNTMPNIPKVRIKSKGIFLGMEDDTLEAKLNLIFRVGARENRLRMEKEQQFEEKVAAINKGKKQRKQQQQQQEQAQSSHSSRSSTLSPHSGPHSVRNGATRQKDSTHSSPLKQVETLNSIDATMQQNGDEHDGIISNNTLTPSESLRKDQDLIHPSRTGSGSAPLSKLESRNTLNRPTIAAARLAKLQIHNTASAIKNFHPSSATQIFPQAIPGVSKKLHRRRTTEESNEIINESAQTDDSTVSIEEARQNLLENFSTSWIRAYNTAEINQKQAVREQMELSMGVEEVDPDTVTNERIIDYSPYPFLFFIFINNPDILIRKPDFDDNGLRNFLFDIGKGLPKDTPFSLLVPLYLHLQASSLRIQIRDYPLPVMHFPELHPSQNRSLPSLSIKGNFVVAEGYSDSAANVRDVDIPLIPEAVGHTEEREGFPFVARVKRTVASVKTYTSLQVNARSHFPTRITYCQAYQPGLQAAMQVFDTFSKPPIDPSDKVGFWDKIRLVFHARFKFNWKESDIHLLFKGSRNPYSLLGESAGFVMVWRNNVVLSVNENDDPKKTFSITSDDYLLAVPNYSLQEREFLLKSITLQNGLVCPTNFDESTTFQKVVMKLSGQVCWYCGILFEREIEKGTSLGRTFVFKPHYTINLCKPEFIKDLETYDAYRGFRSDYLHMAISVISPSQGEWNTENADVAGNNYNSLHLTPKVFAHFYKWWQLFDNALSLPVRNGKMFNFDDPQQKSKKFGRHLFTVKYQLLLAPLYITHSYLTSDFDSKTNSYSHHSTGIKARIGSFTLDLHQRRSPNPGDEDSVSKRWRMNLNIGEMDFINTDLRVLQATFKEKSHQESLARRFGIASSPVSSISNGFSSTSGSTHYTGKIKISDNDYSWIDMDDFDELGETSPASIFPKITVSPVLYSPRWSYFRQTDHDDPHKFGTFIPFGNEDSHDCIIGQRQPEDSHKIIINMRISELEEQLKTNETMLDSLKADLERFPGIKATSDRIKKVQADINVLTERLEKVKTIAQDHFLFTDEIDNTARNVAKNVQIARKVYDDMCAAGLKKEADNMFPGSDPNLLSPAVTRSSSNSPVGAVSELATDSVPQPYEGPSIDDNFEISEIMDEPQIYLSRTTSNASYLSSSGFDQRRVDNPVSRRVSTRSSDSDSNVAPEEYRDDNRDDISIGSARTLEPLDSIANPTGDSMFTNRFIIHSLQLKWNNEVRNSISHYLARVSERKNNAYYITRRAVKYLEDLAEKHAQNEHHHEDNKDTCPIRTEDFGAILRELNTGTPNDDPHFVNMLDDMEGHISAFDANLAAVEGSYLPDEKYLVRLTSPQIQLVSDINPNSAVLVTSENIQLKVIEILDSEQSSDDQSRVIESRYGVFLQDAQFYALCSDDVKNRSYLYFSHNTYGCGKVPTWPPWLAVECCYDESALREFLIIDRTSATLRYDKPNSLRIQKNADTKDLQNTCSAALIRHEMHHQNRITVDFPKIVATTDSKQFFAAYTIVIDLILYSEPVKKQRSEQLDRVLLTTDFSDLETGISQVGKLQKKIRRFDDIRIEFLARMSELDEAAVRNLAKVELMQDILSFELGVMVMAIKTGMHKSSRDEDLSQFFKWTIAADQIIWHVLDSEHKPFMDVGLADASFNRIMGSDGFNSNSVEIGMMQAFNLEHGAIYPDMFSPFAGEKKGQQFDLNEGKLISVNWTMLDPIGGIPIMEKFEVLLRPLKIQIERASWDKIFNFLFPVDGEGKHDDHLILSSSKHKVDNGPHDTYEHFSDDSDSSEEEEYESDDIFSKTNTVSDSDNNSVLQKKFHISNPFNRTATNQSGAGGAASIRSGRTAYSTSSLNKDRESAIRRDLNSSAPRRVNSGASASQNSITSNGSGGSNANSTDSGHHHRALTLGRHHEEPEEDDVDVMMKRASNYVAVVNIRFAPTVLCVSHKGQGSRNILDIHEFVLNVPEIVYQNKMWSNMDLILHLKKDITKILLNHSGSLIGNKIRKHHTRKKGQTTQLHQISNYVSFMSVDELAKEEQRAPGNVPSLIITPTVADGEKSVGSTSTSAYKDSRNDFVSEVGSEKAKPGDSGSSSSSSTKVSASQSSVSRSLSHGSSLRPLGRRDLSRSSSTNASSISTSQNDDDDKSGKKRKHLLKRFRS